MAISLSHIATGTRLLPPKIVLYGVGGIGKTTWAANAPKPVFLFTEDGQGKLDVARFEPRPKDPRLRSWNELLECVRSLHSDQHDYQTCVIDSLDFAEPLLWEHTSAKHKKSDIEAFGYQKGYRYAADEARELLQWLDALRGDRNMAIICICHSAAVKFESPDAESYHRYELRLHHHFSSLVRNWSDALLFANYKVVVVKDDEAFDKKRKRAVGVGERVIYTEERPAWWAKNRYGLLPEIPLSWQAFQDGIVIPPSNDTTEPNTTEEEN
jgi:hypothetical protein